ncbi:hypothetical protein, partial [Campylobacter ornithocola]
MEGSYSPNIIVGGFGGFLGGNKIENIALNNININISEQKNNGYIAGFIGLIETDNLSASNIILNNVSSINGHEFIGSFYATDSKLENIYLYFKPGAYDGSLDLDIPTTILSNIHIYHHKNDLTNATADQSFWGNTNDKINIHTYIDETQGYTNFEQGVLQALASEGLHKDKNGNLIFTTDFEIEKPTQSLPNITHPDIMESQKPLIPNIETIKNEQATLDKDDIISKEDLENQIIADLKDKFYVVDINTLNELLVAYSKIDKNNPTSKAEFLADYLLSKDKYPEDERLDIAHSMIQSLDFLLAYQKNGLKEASNDKFANKEAINIKDKVIADVSEVYTQANANKDKVNNFIQITLKDKVNSINKANENFNKQDYYN